MKLRTIGNSLTILLIAFALYLPTHRERVHIRKRVDAMRQALRNNDPAGVAALVMPMARPTYQTQNSLQRLRLGICGGHAAPPISISGDSATVVAQRKYHYDKILKGNPLGILPGGHSVDMIKENGEWY